MHHRKHVLRDIRAWACTFPGCSFRLFEDRESWFQHEMEHHRRQWECTSCAGALFGSRTAMEGHISKYHPAITSGALPYVLAASSRPLTEIPVSACPLCDDWEIHLRNQPSCPETSAEVQLTVPARVFEQHLSRHLVQLALFSIPRTFETAMSSESSKAEKDVVAFEVRTCLLRMSCLCSRTLMSLL